MNAAVSTFSAEPSALLDLRGLVAELGEHTASLLGTEGAPSPRVLGTEFYETLEELPDAEGTLLLVPSGAQLPEGTLEEISRAAASLGYAGIALKYRDDETGAGAAIERIAREGGLPIVRVSEQVGWRLFEALVSNLLGEQRRSEDAHLERGAEPLFALANELAGFFGGSVAIEDLGRRIVAYSSIPGQRIDTVRTQGILARKVPASPFNDDQYRTLLRSETPVKYPQLDDELPRVACAVRAGTLPLGSIWAIDPSGDGEITPEQAARMRSAAAVAAAHMLDDLRVRETGRLPRENRLRTMLDGDAVGSELAELGIPEERGAALLAFDPGIEDHPATVAQLRSTAHRHLSAHRAEAVTVARAGRVFSLIAADDEARLIALVSPLLPIIDRLVARGIRVALPGAAFRAGAVAILRERAESLFETAANRFGSSGPRVLTIEQLRPQLVFERHARLLADEPLLAHPGIALLLEEHPALAETFSAWCRNLGNIARTARDLGVHENTVRHRIRRTAELAGIDVEQPDALLTAWLQLRAQAS